MTTGCDLLSIFDLIFAQLLARSGGPGSCDLLSIFEIMIFATTRNVVIDVDVVVICFQN